MIDFDEIWYSDASGLSGHRQPIKFYEFNNPRWQQPPSWKIENLTIFATDKPILTKFRMLMHLYALHPIANKISRFQQSKMATAVILKIRKIAISPQWNHRFLRHLAWWWVWVFQTLSANETAQTWKSKTAVAAILNKKLCYCRLTARHYCALANLCVNIS